MSDDRKQDDATKSSDSKHIIELLKNRKICFADMITIWEKMYGCMEQYRCATVLYLMSILAQAYNVIIDHGVGSPGNSREVVNVLNTTEKRFLSMLTKT